jgi:hypothetical protein
LNVYHSSSLSAYSTSLSPTSPHLKTLLGCSKLIPSPPTRIHNIASRGGDDEAEGWYGWSDPTRLLEKTTIGTGYDASSKTFAEAVAKHTSLPNLHHEPRFAPSQSPPSPYGSSTNTPHASQPPYGPFAPLMHSSPSRAGGFRIGNGYEAVSTERGTGDG